MAAARTSAADYQKLIDTRPIFSSVRSALCKQNLHPAKPLRVQLATREPPERKMPANENGLIHVASSRSVPETLKRLQTTVETLGLKVFALVDHSGEAERAGLKMRPTQLLMFGSPKAGTPLISAVPALAIDPPLKAFPPTWSKISRGLVRWSRKRQSSPPRELIPIVIVVLDASSRRPALLPAGRGISREPFQTATHDFPCF
jgi:hypothetical protein